MTMTNRYPLLGLVSVAMVAAGAFWPRSVSAASAPTGDPSKPYYQNTIPGLPIAPGVRIGGTWAQRTPPPPAEESTEDFDTRMEREDTIWERNRKRLQKTIADYSKWFALAVFVIGAYLHFTTIASARKSFGSSLMTGAAFVYAYGAIMRFEATAADWIELVIVLPTVIGIVYALYRRKDKVFSIFKPNPAKEG